MKDEAAHTRTQVEEMSKKVENLIKDEQTKKIEINEAKARIDKLSAGMKEMKLEKAAQIKDLKRYGEIIPIDD